MALTDVLDGGQITGGATLSLGPWDVRIFGTALKAWWDDDAVRLGASLAYYTLFAIAPVLLVATGIAGLVFNTDAVRGEIVHPGCVPSSVEKTRWRNAPAGG